MTDTTTALPSATALLAEWGKQASIAWVELPTRPQPVLVWLTWYEGSALLVTGPDDQSLPEVVDAAISKTPVTLIIRSGDTEGRLLRLTTHTELLDPASQQWQQAANALVGKRLNAPVLPDLMVQRWRAEASVIRLTPTDTILEHPGSLPDQVVAAQPVPTPQTTGGGRWLKRGKG